MSCRSKSIASSRALHHHRPTRPIRFWDGCSMTARMLTGSYSTAMPTWPCSVHDTSAPSHSLSGSTSQKKIDEYVRSGYYGVPRTAFRVGNCQHLLPIPASCFFGVQGSNEPIGSQSPTKFLRSLLDILSSSTVSGLWNISHHPPSPTVSSRRSCAGAQDSVRCSTRDCGLDLARRVRLAK